MNLGGRNRLLACTRWSAWTRQSFIEQAMVEQTVNNEDE
jgi:hypothetical protein